MFNTDGHGFDANLLQSYQEPISVFSLAFDTIRTAGCMYLQTLCFVLLRNIIYFIEYKIHIEIRLSRRPVFQITSFNLHMAWYMAFHISQPTKNDSLPNLL